MTRLQTVFPARVGVFLTSKAWLEGTGGLPRASGGVSTSV